MDLNCNYTVFEDHNDANLVIQSIPKITHKITL